MTVDEKGRRRKKYETYQTPYERLKSIKKVAKCLRPGVSLKVLSAIAAEQTDNESAAAMQAAKDKLFRRVMAAGGAANLLVGAIPRRALDMAQGENVAPGATSCVLAAIAPSRPSGSPSQKRHLS